LDGVAAATVMDDPTRAANPAPGIDIIGTDAHSASAAMLCMV